MRLQTIVALAVVFILSLGFALYFPAGQIIRDLATVPAIGALLAALFLLLRDRIAHDRAILLQQLQATSAVGTTSHMANVAFDKHVTFSEEYLDAALEVIAQLTSKGPSGEAVTFAQRLTTIRRKHSLWITPDLNLSLEKFEWSIWRIGRLSLQLPGLEFDPTLYRDEQKRIQAAYFDVLGISGEDDQAKQQQAIDKVILRLQELLGNTDLTQLRARLVKNATQTLQNPD